MIDIDEVDYIEMADITAAAGSGYFVLDNVKNKKHFPVAKSMLKEYGLKPKYTLVVPVKGRSMEPTVPDGCLVLLDTTPIEDVNIIHEKVYVISLEDLCYIKRFKLIPRSRVIKGESDNRDFAFTDLTIDKEVSQANLKIIGRLACIVKSSYGL